MDIAYAGLPEGGLALLEAGHRIVAAASTRTAGPELEALRRALVASSAPLDARPDLRDPERWRPFAGRGGRLLVCYLWDRVLPAGLLDAFVEGAIGYHPSLLPRHRGPDPYFWTLWLGDETAGASVFRLAPGLDSGPVLARRALPVQAEWDAGRLAARLDGLGLELLVEAVGRWAREGPLPGEPQDESAATLAPAPDDDLLEIRWGWPAARIARLVRAGAPHPGAFTTALGELLVILAARARPLEEPGALEPGDAVLGDEGVVICTGRGALLLDEVATGDGTPLRGARIAALLPGLSRLPGL